MSATIDQDSFCQNMGFLPEETSMIDTQRCPFLLENRKVEFVNTARLTYKSLPSVENRIWLKIDEILSLHKNQIGLILTSSIL